MKRPLLAVFILVLSTLFYSPLATAAARPQTLRMGWSGGPPAVLDSALTTDPAAMFILTQTMEGLVRQDADGAIRKGSGAAADWTVSADGLTYTFTLKQGLTWSDGKPLTSRDFAYAWLRAMDPADPGDYSYLLYFVAGAAEWAALDPESPDFAAASNAAKAKVGIRTPDDQTLAVTLEAATPFFLRLLVWPVTFPQRSDLLKKHGERYGTSPDTIAYNGPFALTQWTPEQRLRLQTNPRYWNRAAVRLSEVTVQFSGDEAGLARQRSQGLLDLVEVSDGTASQYRNRSDYWTDSRDTTQYLLFNLNETGPDYLKNVHIRRALHLAIDRQYLAEQAYAGAAAPAVGFVPDGIHLAGITYRAAAGDLVPKRADLKAAKAELAAGLKALGKKSLPPVRLLALNSSLYDGPTAALKEMWTQNLGLTVEVSRVSFRTRLERVGNGDFDLAYVGWAADYDDPDSFLGMFISGNSWGDTAWRSADYDRLAGSAGLGSTLDNVHRLVNAVEAERILVDELPISPLLFPANATLRAPHVQGIIAMPTGAYLDLSRAWIVP